ncbi:MAG: CpsD/CapB family tyrosine-protein kinase [Vicinamibacterales bacterium]
MSRFGKAIERAHSGAPSTTSPAMAPTEAPDDAVFDAAWDVKDAPPPPPPDRPARAVPRSLDVHPALSEKVATPTGAPTVALEQYRKLAAKLHQWQLDHDGKVVMMVSAVAGEGKTLTTVNLALTLSGSYQKRVLVIDCDLRRPTIHGAFQIAGSPGVADIVERSEIPVVRITERLSVVPAGRVDGDPMGILTSNAMAALLEHARREYDWVLLDTAPLAVLPDANLLADHVDGSVLVVSAGATAFELVDTAIRVIGKERVLGVVLNGVDPRDMSTANYHADYYGRR